MLICCQAVRIKKKIYIYEINLKVDPFRKHKNVSCNHAYKPTFFKKNTQGTT